MRMMRAEIRRRAPGAREALLVLAVLAATAAGAASSARAAGCVSTRTLVTCTFDTAGTSTWTVPRGVSRVTFDVEGAHGGFAAGFFPSTPAPGGSSYGLPAEVKAT